MSSVGTALSETEERLAINWHASRRFLMPPVLDQLARVVHVIERRFLSDRYNHWIADGSVYFCHKKSRQSVVRVWVDYDNALSDRLLKLPISRMPIAVGIDLTAYRPIQRHRIREYLRATFQYYCDPEQVSHPIAPYKVHKIMLRPDSDHWLDVVFFPEVPRAIPINEKQLIAVQHAIGEGASSWCS